MSLNDNTSKIADILAKANALPDMSEGIALDTTLTQSGKAADAKAVGDALAGKQPKGDYLTQNTLQTATNTALAQAKASGEFDGADGITPHIGDNGNWYLGDTDTGKPSRGDTGATGPKGDKGADGKSAYQYAVEGGYTGTEAEFAAKMETEKFANPFALTFTGAVTGSYDGTTPMTVNIPSAVTDDHINSLIDTKLGVIENGTY